ncbi:YtxH domain-containing protein [Virgibacillus halophilus]|uniref:YtxH domain-containing protein n=1 Tax=Tigheibacillus halophilus TaxID=361280 RepID=A0ABU5C8X7_9BACI|nr:YtxH domain-containing protein [Virgibacillus halophilus]
MGKRKLLTGIISGAVIGGIVALFDKDARGYAKEKISSAKSCSANILKNPSEALRNVSGTVNSFNTTFSNQVDNAINALEQVEDTVNKVIKRG